VHGPAPDGDDLDPAAGGQLHQEQPDTAAAAQDQQPGAGAQRQPGQGLPGGPGRQRGSCCRRQRGARADRGDLVGVHDGEFRVPADAVGEVRHCHHPIAGAQPGNPRPEALDHAGYVVSEDARHPQASPAAISPVERVDRVDARRMNRYPDLALTGHGICDIGQAQLLRAAELANDHSLHPVSFPPRTGCRTP